MGLGMGALVAAAVIDARLAIIPNSATLVIAVAGLLEAITTSNWIGPLVGTGTIAIVVGILSWTRGWRAGAGDVKLGLAVGLWLMGLLGAFALVVGLLVAQLAAAVARRRQHGLPVHGGLDFARFLLAGTLAAALLTLWPLSWTLAFRAAP
jgi:prepilin signal peptidase PulO-like enzyme (type II secretory pathway)